MASSKAPKHDFAPAWLKIPSQDNPRPSGGKQERWGNGRKDDNYGSYHHPRYVPDYMYGQLPRQRSFESYDDRRHSGSSKYRQHSIDDDYYNQSGYSGYYNNGYYNTEKYGNHYRSQPMLYRPGPGNRDGKYHHPHSRYNSQMNGGGSPSYYDNPYEFYHGEPYYGGTYNNSRHKPNEDDAKLKESRKERRMSGDEKSKQQLEEEFPTLNGQPESEGKRPMPQGKIAGGSAWDVHRKDKGLEKSGSMMYKATVPSKSTHARKAQESPKINGQESSRDNLSSPIEVQSPGVQVKPKQYDRKSEVLKTIRKRGTPDINSNDKTSPDDHGDEELVNSLENLKVERLGSNLSSSLEAEQRLLREMGWNEADEEDYVITEDDMKEFQNLSEQMRQKNGITKPTLPKSWSPKHLNSYNLLDEAELNDTLSSTDTDSDMD